MTRRTAAQYNWGKLEFDETLLTKHFTVQASKTVKFIVVHHMTIVGSGNGSALDACYNVWQSRAASAHYGIDGALVRQYVWDRNYAWSTGDTDGNRYGISIEHANSAAGPKWTVADATWKTGAKLAAHLHKTYKLGRPVSGKTLRKHSSFKATACPGPYMDSIWSTYVAEVQRVYDSLTGAPTPTPEQPIVWTSRADEYRVDITLPVYGRTAPHVDATKVTAALAVGSIIYATEITTRPDGDWVRSKFGTCFKASSLTLISDEPVPEQPEPEPGATQYTVIPGDTLNSIAARHGLSLAQLLALNGLDIIQPGLVLAVTDDVDPEPTPEPEPEPTATMVGFNLKSPTLLGKWLTWPFRRTGQIKIITDPKPTVVFIQEAGPPAKVKWYDTELAKYGLTNARAYDSNGSGRWRLIYHDQTFDRVAAHLYIIGPRIADDDKQMAVEIAERGGIPYFFGSFHLENESGAKFDTLRVDQMQDCFAEMIRCQKTYGIAPEHCILQGDTNSETWVRDWVEENTDYRDAAKLARVATDVDQESANSWEPSGVGPRIDYFLVHKNAIVNTFDQVDAHKVSDHDAQVINVNI